MSTEIENDTLELMKNDPDFLKYLAEHDSIFLKSSHKEYEMQRDRKYLQMHDRSIWQGKDGDFHLPKTIFHKVSVNDDLAFTKRRKAT